MATIALARRAPSTRPCGSFASDDTRAATNSIAEDLHGAIGHDDRVLIVTEREVHADELARPEQVRVVAELRRSDDGADASAVAVDTGVDTLLEELYVKAISAGVAAGRRLQPQVRAAISRLANGLMDANPDLRTQLEDDPDVGRDLYRELLTVLDGLQPPDSGGFWAYDGQRLPW